MAIVGTLSGTNEPVIFILDNVFCTSGLELGMEDTEAVSSRCTRCDGSSCKRMNTEKFYFQQYLGGRLNDVMLEG